VNRRFGSILFVLVVIALAVSACGGSQLTYRVSGDAAEAHVAYADADGDTQEETVALPWETSFGIGREFDFKINVENAGEAGSVACGVWINDKRAGETSGARFVECSGSFSGSKSSHSVNYHGRYDVPSEQAIETATEEADVVGAEPTPTKAPPPTPEPTATRSEPVVTFPPVTEFARYEHTKNCVVYDDKLWLDAFSVLYPDGAVIQDCEENPQNYVAFYFEPEGDNEDAALMVGWGSFNIVPPDPDTYPEKARGLMGTLVTQIQSQLQGQDISSDPIVYQGDTLIHYDFDAVVKGVPRLVRLVAMPNFDHGHGVVFLAIQKISLPAEEAFPAFDEMTREIIASFEFSSEEVAASGGDLVQYEHNLDCSAYNEQLQLKSFSTLYPAESVISDCRDNPDNYVIFELNPDEDQQDSDLAVVLGHFHIDAPADQLKSKYLSSGEELLNILGPQFAAQLKAELTDDQPLEYQGIPYYRRDYVGEMWGSPRLVRLVTIPNFEHGHGIFLLALKKIESTPEAEFPEFDALTQRIIGSVAWSPAESKTGGPTSPEEVVQAVFDAAQSGDFAAVGDLCDPLGENDSDTQIICGAATDDTSREQIIEFFAKGKINGDTQISPNGNEAQVPILFGPDGDREETMVLIKRDGRWYLLGF